MYKYCLWLCALISLNVTAQQEVCEWGESVLKVGESAWVEEPNLANLGGSRDWSGYRVECTYTYSLVTTEFSGEVNDVIEQGEAQMVLREVYRDFHNKIQTVKYLD